ncbi:MAG TPA: aldo/keto reductase [Caldimonas sp.]|jgi:diketogulonate reductase-like aldo/keto reductase|nr:aldo/keto reductase [Caldimonas sp.]HEX4234624.1 aldo/keto reductase [Caldimonas sp.]
MLTFPGSLQLPSLGLGTWRVGESAARRKREVGAVRAALDIGWRVIDTAEMYGDGGAESIVGEAIADALRAGAVTREQLFVVSKVSPQNSSARGAVAACDRSLSRLRLDHLDGYLLHWRGEVPLAETVDAFEALRARGRIRNWGVSNFDVDDMVELMRVPGGDRCATDQIYYSLSARGAAFDLVPWLRTRGIATMAYSPIDQGALARNAALAAIAKRRGVTAAQLALAWLIAQRGVMAIPKAVSEAHLRENLAAGAIILDVDETAALDRAFPPPKRKTPLAMI